MRLFFLLIATYVLSAVAQETAPPTAAATAAQPVPQQAPPILKKSQTGEQLSTVRDNVFEEVDIIGDGLLFSPTIWSDMLKLNDADKVVQETIEEKKFANDEYFMRNIDREEFEEEQLLLLFDDRIRLYDKYIAEMKKQLAGDSATSALQAMEPQQ